MHREELLRDEDAAWLKIYTHAEKSVGEVRKLWRANRRVDRMLMAWPSEFLQTESGVITHIVSFAVPDGMAMFEGAVALATQAKAFALMSIDRQDNTIKIILESPRGTRSWIIPISRHGDIEVLEKEKAAKNTDWIGVLWRPSIGKG